MLLLPNYEGRVPVIVIPYGGEEAPSEFRDDFGNLLNPRILTDHGYGVFLPSLPMSPMGRPSEPCSEIAQGITAAVEAVKRRPEIDPTAIGLLGESYGGYSVLCAIGGERFQAAVAMSSIVNLETYYGTFDRRYRYSDDLAAVLLGPLTELQQPRMASPPWRDPQRYWRNNPVRLVGDIRTPLLIIDGTADISTTAGSEEYSTALFREGKEVDFVRYVGEQHGIASPANQRDFWKRVFSWFDWHLNHSPRAESRH